MNNNNLKKAQEDNVLAKWYWLGSFLFEIWIKIILFPVGGEKKWRLRFLNFIDPKPTDRIIELCCGTGNISIELARKVTERKIKALDLSSNLIRIAKRRAKKVGLDIEYSVQDASDTSYPSSSFDKVVISIALHEITQPRRKAIYHEILRLLHPKGFFYLTEPAKPKRGVGLLWHNIFWFLNRIERKTASELFNEGLRSELEIAGFKIEESMNTNLGFFQCLKCSSNR